MVTVRGLGAVTAQLAAVTVSSTEWLPTARLEKVTLPFALIVCGVPPSTATE